MKREGYLRDLSSDHHQALRLVRAINNGLASPTDPRSLISDVRLVFAKELEPHFVAEEQMILPELERLGESALVERTLDEHHQLRYLVSNLDTVSALAQFAEALKAHVHFEERVLFPACQDVFDDVAITRVGDKMNAARSR